MALRPLAITLSPSRRSTSRVSGSLEASRFIRRQSTSRVGCGVRTFCRLGKNIFNEGARNNAERHFTVNAAEGEVIDLETEGRDVRALPGIDVDGENVLSVEIEMRSEVERKWRVAALIFAEANAVNPDGRSGHDTFKIDEDMLALGFGRQAESGGGRGRRIRRTCRRSYAMAI